MAISLINTGDTGVSVRTKLNAIIGYVNTTPTLPVPTALPDNQVLAVQSGQWVATAPTGSAPTSIICGTF